jgi:hypothetical protein
VNGHGSGGAPRAFDLRSESALAWQFVLANWPAREPSKPVLRVHSGGFRVLMSSHPDVLATLREVCRLAERGPGTLAISAEALSAEIERHEAGTLEPALQA